MLTPILLAVLHFVTPVRPQVFMGSARDPFTPTAGAAHVQKCQGNTGGSANTLIITCPSATTAGNVFNFCTGNYSSQYATNTYSTSNSVTETVTTLIFDSKPSASYRFHISCYTILSMVGGWTTLTLNDQGDGSFNYMQAGGDEFSLPGTHSLDGYSSAVNSTTSVSPIAAFGFTTTASGDIVYGEANCDGPTGVTPVSGYTAGGSTGTGYLGVTAYQIQGAPSSSTTVSWTVSNSNYGDCNTYAFAIK